MLSSLKTIQKGLTDTMDAESYDFGNLEGMMDVARMAKASTLAVAIYEKTTGPFKWTMDPESERPTPEEEVVLKIMSDLDFLMEAGSGELVKALDKLVEEGTG